MWLSACSTLIQVSASFTSPRASPNQRAASALRPVKPDRTPAQISTLAGAKALNWPSREQPPSVKVLVLMVVAVVAFLSQVLCDAWSMPE